jgi:TRAP-type uncharacterized transport system substrate-binding protein
MAGHEAGRSSAGENSLEGEIDAEAHPCDRRRRGVVATVRRPVQAQQKTISIGTGGTGGVYYPLGGAVASVLSKHLPGVQATAEVTGGSVDNLKLIGTGQSEIGFSMADAALDAAQGQDKFKSGKVNLKTLMVLYPNRMHVVTIEGHRHREDGGPQGQARLDRLARRRHRGDGVSVIEAAGLDRTRT